MSTFSSQIEAALSKLTTAMYTAQREVEEADLVVTTADLGEVFVHCLKGTLRISFMGGEVKSHDQEEGWILSWDDLAKQIDENAFEEDEVEAAVIGLRHAADVLERILSGKQEGQP